MKTIIVTALVSALLATSAVAAPRASRTHAGYSAVGQLYGDARAQAYDERAYDARAYAPDVVISGDRVLGYDPDPTIRTQMRQQGDVADY